MSYAIWAVVFMIPVAALLTHYQEGPAALQQLAEPHALLAAIMLLMALYFGLVVPEENGANLRMWRRTTFGFLPTIGFLSAVFHQPRHVQGVQLFSRFTLRGFGVALLAITMLSAILTQGVGAK